MPADPLSFLLASDTIGLDLTAFFLLFKPEDPRDATVFISMEVSDKIVLLAAAFGSVVFSTDTFQGKDGFKLECNAVKFQELRDLHHASANFQTHPQFMKVLSWVCEKIGWKRLKEKYLDQKHSICLLADNDVDEKRLKRQCKLSFQKATFVQYVASTCLSKSDSF